MLTEKYNEIILTKDLLDGTKRIYGAYEENKSSATYEEFIQLLDYNLIGKTSHIKELMGKIKEFKILNLHRKTSSSNSITLRLSLNENIAIEPKSFSSLNKIEEFSLKREYKTSNATPNEAYEYEPVITGSDFSSFGEKFSKINLGLITTTTNQFNSYSYDNYNVSNHIPTKNNLENTTKYGFDNYYRENSEKNSNDGLFNKGFSLNTY